jgi:osmotically-inducible protein OsmY
MNTVRKRRNWMPFAYVVPLICGLGAFASRVDAQNAAAPADSRSASIAASTTQVADWVADEELKKRVKSALHADLHFSDEHVSVSVEKGVVVLRGFVFNDRDLQDALRIARKAAGDKPVRDSLSIERGGP